MKVWDFEDSGDFFIPRLESCSVAAMNPQDMGTWVGILELVTVFDGNAGFSSTISITEKSGALKTRTPPRQFRQSQPCS